MDQVTIWATLTDSAPRALTALLTGPRTGTDGTTAGTSTPGAETTGAFSELAQNPIGPPATTIPV